MHAREAQIPPPRIVAAESPVQLATAADLFCHYAQAIGIDLSFQGFQRELATLPGPYAKPAGRIALAMVGDQAAGCVAIKPLDPQTAEMKRLYVQPAYRGAGAGRLLATWAIDQARLAGYQRMRLDTLARMTQAVALYESLGFVRIDAYYVNPLPDVVYFERDLGR